MATSARLGYNGTLHEPGMRWQLLGNGRRVFNPVLMRFHSPDSLSPFSRGGHNAYAYCNGNPINLHDPSGGIALPLLMMGFGVAAGAGAGAMAAPSASDSSDGDNTLAWIIGGVIAGAAVAGLALMAGKAGDGWATVLKKPRKTHGKPSLAAPTSTSKPVVQASRPVPSNELPYPPSGHIPATPRIWHDKKGRPNVFMSELDDYARRRILQIRKFAPGGTQPAKSRDWLGKPFKNPGDRLLPLDRTGNYYHTYPVYFGKGHGYEAWRVITGGTHEKIHTIRLTFDHYDSNVMVADWGTYNPS